MASSLVHYTNFGRHRAIAHIISTDVKALFTTPFIIVPALGSGSVILVASIFFDSIFNTTPYAGANNLEFRYTNAAGQKAAVDIAAATLNFGSGTRESVVPGPVTLAEFTPVENAPIVVCVPTANPTAGDSEVKLTVIYDVVFKQ